MQMLQPIRRVIYYISIFIYYFFSGKTRRCLSSLLFLIIFVTKRHDNQIAMRQLFWHLISAATIRNLLTGCRGFYIVRSPGDILTKLYWIRWSSFPHDTDDTFIARRSTFPLYKWSFSAIVSKCLLCTYTGRPCLLLASSQCSAR